MSEIKQVTDWIDAAGQEPSVRNVANYTAFVLSECAEMLLSIGVNPLSIQMEAVSIKMRNGVYDSAISYSNKVRLLDDACDIAWTAIGLMHMLGDAQGAFAEVAASNYSKMQDGVLVKDATGKVVKGPDYFKPDLAKFLR